MFKLCMIASRLFKIQMNAHNIPYMYDCMYQFVSVVYTKAKIHLKIAFNLCFCIHLGYIWAVHNFHACLLFNSEYCKLFLFMKEKGHRTAYIFIYKQWQQHNTAIHFDFLLIFYFQLVNFCNLHKNTTCHRVHLEFELHFYRCKLM